MNLTSKYPQRVEKLSMCSPESEEYSFSVENDIKGAKQKKAPFHFKNSIFSRFNEKIPFFFIDLKALLKYETFSDVS